MRNKLGNPIPLHSIKRRIKLISVIDMAHAN